MGGKAGVIFERQESCKNTMRFFDQKPAYKNDFISIILLYYWYDDCKERMFYLCSEFE